VSASTHIPESLKQSWAQQRAQVSKLQRGTSSPSLPAPDTTDSSTFADTPDAWGGRDLAGDSSPGSDICLDPLLKLSSPQDIITNLRRRNLVQQLQQRQGQASWTSVTPPSDNDQPKPAAGDPESAGASATQDQDAERRQQQKIQRQQLREALQVRQALALQQQEEMALEKIKRRKEREKELRQGSKGSSSLKAAFGMQSVGATSPGAAQPEPARARRSSTGRLKRTSTADLPDSLWNCKPPLSMPKKLSLEILSPEARAQIRDVQAGGSPRSPLVAAEWCLSVAAMASAPPAVKAPSGPVKLCDMRALVVDDVPINRSLLIRLLLRLGLASGNIREAADGIEAVEAILGPNKLDNWTPHLCFMDVQMPRLGGHGATQRLREQGWTGAIVAVTGSVLQSDVQECLEAGMTSVMSKPIRLAVVKALVRKYSK